MTAKETQLLALMKGFLPSEFYKNEEDPQEILYAFAKTHGANWDAINIMFSNTFIGSAQGIFLDLHGLDRNLRRQNNETDDAYRSRIQTLPDQVTKPAIMTQVSTILTSAGIAQPTGYPAMVELRQSKAFFGNSYFDNGYRFGNTLPEIIVILPPGSEDIEATVLQAVNKTKAGGVVAYVELAP